MNKMVALLVSVPLTLGTAGSAMAQTAENTEVEPAQTAVQPRGAWQYVDGSGWVWVPAGTVAYDVDTSPYVYVYTPSLGWNWYVSPWGWGPYYAGAWVHHPYGWGRGGWGHGYAYGGRAAYGRGYTGGRGHYAVHARSGHFGGAHFGGGHGGRR